MSIALALIAMLIELCLGYPEQLFRVIGHPVTWMGRLISMLDRRLNNATMSARQQRTAGVLAVFILLVVVTVIAVVVERGLLRIPFGIFVTGLLGGTLIAQRSL